MPKLEVIAPTTESNSSAGPKYDEDFNILDEGSEPVNDGIDDDDDALGDDEESDTPPREPADHDDDDEKDEELDDEDKKNKEDEEEDEEDEDKDEDETPGPYNRPSVKDIKSKYPEFFKDFPDIRDAIFRENEFNKLFPSVEDAKEAFEDNEAFNNLSESVLGGDPVPLLESIEKTDAKALDLFSRSFLPALYKRSPDVYQQVVTPLFENLLRQAYKTGDDNMKNSAINVAQFLFGGDSAEDIVQGKKTLVKSSDIGEEQKKINEDRDKATATKFRETYHDVDKSIRKALYNKIAKDFDPDNVFSKFLKQKGIETVIERVYKQLDSDGAHKSVMGARWRRARLNGFSEDEKVKIVSTFLARAKSLIPGNREKVRGAMLGTKQRASGVRERTVQPPVRKENNSGRAPTSKDRPARMDYSKMSDMDILNT